MLYGVLRKVGILKQTNGVCSDGNEQKKYQIYF